VNLRRVSVFVPALLIAGLLARAEDQPGPAITMAAFGGRETNPDQTCGDTWDTAWLADGRLLTQYNDGNGFSLPHSVVHHDGVCELQGTPEDISTIKGIDLNPGKLGHFLGATYSTGLYELDGALYHFCCRSIQIPGKWRFYDTCLYKSTDGGATWINQLGQKNRYIPAELSAATFPDKRWGEVNFVKYGRGGETPDIDRARDFAYLSTGHYLARIRRTDLRAWTTTFDPSRIEYYCGSANADGEQDANWTRQISRCTPTSKNASRLGTILWNPGLKRYLTASGISDSWQKPPVPSTLFLYDAPHPWGPWTEIDSEYIEPRVGDNLTWVFLMQPFMSADGTRMWASVSGRKPYGLQFLPIYLTTQPVETRLATEATRTGTNLGTSVKGSLSPAYIEGFHQYGDGCTFTIPVARAGLYALHYHYHCDDARETISLTVNGHLYGHLALGNTLASRLPWNQGSVRIPLTAGTASLQFHLAAGDRENSHFLLDRIQLGLLSSSAKP
jgi:hypothetical protein